MFLLQTNVNESLNLCTRVDIVLIEQSVPIIGGFPQWRYNYAITRSAMWPVFVVNYKMTRAKTEQQYSTTIMVWYRKTSI